MIGGIWMDDGGWMDREEPVQIGVPFSVEHMWWHMTSGVRSQGEGKARVHVCLATNACVPACLPACLPAYPAPSRESVYYMSEEPYPLLRDRSKIIPACLSVYRENVSS